MFKSILGTALGLALMAGSAGAQETLTVGANIGNVPWEFQDADGNIVGFEIDLVTEVAERLGRPLQIENIPFQGLFSAVQSGRIDIAVSSITITQERLGSVAFAQPYYDSDQSLTVAEGGPATLEEMSGKVVGVDTGSTGDMWATDYTSQYGFGEIRRYEGLAPAMLDLQAGRIDGYISDIPALLYYVKDKPDLQVVARIVTNEKYSMMFAKDNDALLNEVNEILSALKTEGFMSELHEKWFGATPEDTTSTVMVQPIPTAN